MKGSQLSTKTKRNSELSNAPRDVDPICIDWYLVTTVYDEEGIVIDYYEVYLFTTCDTGGGGGGGGGGGEEPIDQEIVTAHTAHLVETEYTEDDYVSEIGEDFSGLATVPPPTYDCSYYVHRAALTHMIVGITMFNVTAHPSSITYYNYAKGNILRVVTPITINTNYTRDPTFQGAVCVWTFEANFRWTYLSQGTSTTRQYHKTKTQIVTPLM